MSIRDVMVIGAGAAGSGIAQVCAQHGMTVCLVDVKEEQLTRARHEMMRSLSELWDKEQPTQSPDAVLRLVTFTTRMEEGRAVQAVIEAVYEEVDVKKDVIAHVDRITKDAIFIASNTSAIPITHLAEGITAPERVLGLHFSHPITHMGVVEVIRGRSTSQRTVGAGTAFVRALGKRPIIIRRDVAGFALNRINVVAIAEAIRLVEQGVASIEEIDAGMRLAFGHRMGPFETMDLMGLDVVLSTLSGIYQEEGDAHFMPPSLLLKMVAAGSLGRKTGQGWYSYGADGKRGGR